MTLTEIAEMVEDIGLEWRYSHFSQTPNPPYVVYNFPAENHVYADGSNYVNKRQLFIELYTKTKDITSESAVESKLAEAGLTWYMQRDFLSDEELYQTTYEMEVIING